MSLLRRTVTAASLALLFLPGSGGAQAVSLGEYVRLRQAQAAASTSVHRQALERRAAEALERLLAAAPHGSILVVAAERRRDSETAAAIELARLAARGGRATMEALGGERAQSPTWQRAGEIGMDAYLAVTRRLLEEPAFLSDEAPQQFDPNAPGPRRAVTVRFTVGEEAREMRALYGQPYERLSAVVAAVLEFSRTVPLRP